MLLWSIGLFLIFIRGAGAFLIGSGVLDINQGLITHIRFVWRYDFIYASYVLHSCHDTCLWLYILEMF